MVCLDKIEKASGLSVLQKYNVRPNIFSTFESLHGKLVFDTSNYGRRLLRICEQTNRVVVWRWRCPVAWIVWTVLFSFVANARAGWTSFVGTSSVTEQLWIFFKTQLLVWIFIQIFFYRRAKFSWVHSGTAPATDEMENDQEIPGAKPTIASICQLTDYRLNKNGVLVFLIFNNSVLLQV